MRRLWTRAVLGLSCSLGALALSCGSGGSEGLFSPSSSAGEVGTSGGPSSGGSVGGSGVAGASNHAAGANGTPHGGGGSGNGTAGSGGSGQAGHPAGGSAGAAMGGAAGHAAAGAPGNTGGGGAGGKGAGGAAGTGGSGGAGGSLCVDNSGCTASEYCAKATCQPKAEGHCTALPKECASPKLDAVCGCDGLTYFDTCLAHENRQNVSATGACGKDASTTVTCTLFSSKGCTEAGGVCGIATDSCSGVGATDTGLCWVLPEVCPAADAKPALTCLEKAECTSECNAIKSGRYTLAGKCN